MLVWFSSLDKKKYTMIKMKQPKALPIAFLTEMWERFGFYLIQGLLVLLLANIFGMSNAQSSTITGTFIGLIYTTSIIGGMVADKWIGHYRSIVIGQFMLIAAYTMVGISVAVDHYTMLLISLALIAMGTGLVKANVSAHLSNFYSPKDPARDYGYSVFYTGINLGAFLGSISSGYLYTYFGWSLPFFVCAIGAVIGCLTILYGAFKCGIDIEKEDLDLDFVVYSVSLAVIGLATASCLLILMFSVLSDIVFGLVFLACLVILIADYKKFKLYRRRIIAYMMLLLISIVFWSMYFQFYTAFIIIFKALVSQNILGFHVPVPSYLSFMNIGVVLFGGFLGKFWLYRSRIGKPIHDGQKFVLALFIIGIAITILAGSVTYSVHHGVLISGYIIILVCLIVSLSDLSLSPIGLSAACKLAPNNRQGTYMGIWLISIGLGGKLAGVLATLTAAPAKLSAEQSNAIYMHGLWFNVIIISVFFVIGLLMIRPLKRLI